MLLDEDQLVDPESFSQFSIATDFHQARVKYDFTPTSKIKNSLIIGIGTDISDIQIDSDRRFFKINSDLFRIRDELTADIYESATVRVGTTLDFKQNRVKVRLPRPPRRGEFDYDFLTAEVIDTEDTQGQNIYSFYGEYEQRLGPVTLIGGLQMSTTDLAPYWLGDPRMQVRYQVTEKTTLKAAAGLYHQYPQPQEFIEEAGGNPADSPPGAERAFHYLAGIEQKLPWNLVFLVEGYYKDLDRDLRGNPNTQSRIRLLNDAVGRAYGAEFTLRKPLSDQVFGWINYSYARSERKEPGDAEWTPSEFDQPHILNAVLSWEINTSWRVGSRYRFATGNPTFSNVNAIYYADRQQYLPIQSEIRDQRQPNYQRLDIRGDYIKRYDRWKFTTYLEILNVFLHDNPIGDQDAYDFSSFEYINSFPFLVNFGVKADF